MKNFNRSLVLGACLFLTAGVAEGAAVRQFVDFAFNSSNEPRVVGYDEESSLVRLGVYSSSSWTCTALSNAVGMGGGLITTGARGVALLDVSGTPYVAYTVFKRLYPEDPFTCGITYVDREQLWLQKGTTQDQASQVCIDSTGSMFGCVNWSNVGAAVALAHSGDGRVHAAYVAGANALRYAVSNTGVTEFASESVGATTLMSSGNCVALVVDTEALPHLVHVLNGEYVYRVKRPTTGWSQVALQVPSYPNGYAGRPVTGVSLVVDGSGLAAVAYAVGDSLWFAKESEPDVFATPELVDGGAGFAGYPALARNTAEVFYASYSRVTSGQEHAYFATRGSGSWGTPTPVASHNSPLGPFSNKRLRLLLTSGSSELPRIAYPTSNPDGGAAIWLASYNGSSWSTSIAVPCGPPPGGGGGGGCTEDCDPYEMEARVKPVTGIVESLMLLVPSVQRGAIIAAARLPDRSREFRFELFDVVGRRVGAVEGIAQSSETSVRFEGLSTPGLYLLRLRSGDGQTVTARTVVVR